MCFALLPLDPKEGLLFHAPFESRRGNRLMSFILGKTWSQCSSDYPEQKMSHLAISNMLVHWQSALKLDVPYPEEVSTPYNIYPTRKLCAKKVDVLDGLALLLKRRRKDDVATSYRSIAGPKGTVCIEFLWTRKGVPEPDPEEVAYLNAVMKRIHFGKEEAPRRILPLVARHCRSFIIFHMHKLANAVGMHTKKVRPDTEDILGIRLQYKYPEFAREFLWQRAPQDAPEHQLWRRMDNFLRTCAKQESQITAEDVILAVQFSYACVESEPSIYKFSFSRPAFSQFRKLARLMGVPRQIIKRLPADNYKTKYCLTARYIPSPAPQIFRLNLPVHETLNHVARLQKLDVNPFNEEDLDDQAFCTTVNQDVAKGAEIEVCQHTVMTMITHLLETVVARPRPPRSLRIGLSVPPCRYCRAWLDGMNDPSLNSVKTFCRGSKGRRSYDWLPFDTEDMGDYEEWIEIANYAVESEISRSVAQMIWKLDVNRRDKYRLSDSSGRIRSESPGQFDPPEGQNVEPFPEYVEEDMPDIDVPASNELEHKPPRGRRRERANQVNIGDVGSCVTLKIAGQESAGIEQSEATSGIDFDQNEWQPSHRASDLSEHRAQNSLESSVEDEAEGSLEDRSPPREQDAASRHREIEESKVTDMGEAEAMDWDHHSELSDESEGW